MTDPLTPTGRAFHDARHIPEFCSDPCDLVQGLIGVEQAARADTAALVEAARAVVDDWDESLRLWLAAGEEEGIDGPAMSAIRDPEREARRVANEAALRAALEATDVT